MPRAVGLAKESWKLRTQWTLKPNAYAVAQMVAEGYDNEVIAELLHYHFRHVSNLVARIAQQLQMPQGYLARPYIAKLYWQGKIERREARHETDD